MSEEVDQAFLAAVDSGEAIDHGVSVSSNGTAPAAVEEEPLVVEVDTIEAFSAVEEPGADPLIGRKGDVLIAEDGDVMVFGAGGSGKTTFVLDGACHLGAGQDWIGLPVPRALRVLMIEVEGPRPLFRAKARRKLGAWDGQPIEGRILILRSPWARFTFADERWRAELARIIEDGRIDVVIAGPLTRIGMESAGTLQETRDFMRLVDDVRARCSKRVAVVLIHHENRAGSVSGAWEGVGDTLLHVREAGPGHTVVRIEKARWGSSYQGTTLKLAWAPGEGFEVEAERDLLAEVRHLLADGKWRIVEEIRKELGVGKDAVSGVIKDHPDDFKMATGEDARALERSKSAQLYQVAS
jgi:hypothetical protein